MLLERDSGMFHWTTITARLVPEPVQNGMSSNVSAWEETPHAQAAKKTAAILIFSFMVLILVTFFRGKTAESNETRPEGVAVQFSTANTAVALVTDP